MKDRKTASTVALIVFIAAACGQAAEQESFTEMAAAVSDARVQAEALMPNGRSFEEGILTGGQPSEEQLQLARDQGVRTVVNLRTDGESQIDREEVEAAGLQYFSLPIEGAAGLTEANARLLAQTLEEAELPVMVHCGSGNRVGALFALKAFYSDGATPEEAFETGRRAGMTRLEGEVRRILDEASGESPPDG